MFSQFKRNYHEARRNIKAIPGATKFQQQYGDKLVTGDSGIIPFLRSTNGQFFVPGARPKKLFSR